MVTEFDIPSDEEKGHDHDHVTIRDEVEQASPVANPQFNFYFFCLYAMAVFFLGMLLPVLLALLPDRKQSPFKAPSGVFVIMSMVTLSVNILASASLIFTSHFFKNYMRNIHYTTLKSIGMLSGFLFLFSTGCLTFITEKPNWSWYTVMGVIFVAILFLFYFVWKHTLVHQENFKEPHVQGGINYTLFLAGVCVVSVPSSVKLHTILPKKLFWIHLLIIFAQLSALVPGILELVKWYKTRKQGTNSSPVVEQDIQTIIHPSLAT